MSNTKKNQAEEPLLESVSKTQEFFNKYKNVMLYVAIAILVICAGSAAYYFLGYAPKKQEAEEATTQQIGLPRAAYNQVVLDGYFMSGNFEVALNGNDQVLGFADIIDMYGKKAGAAVYAYAGICELNLKNYENAINYFKHYNGKEPLMQSRIYAAEGDAYCGLEEYGKAIESYKKAVKASKSQFNAEYLLNAGLASEKLGELENALSFYKTVQNDYPQSTSAMMIDKYIARVETMLAK